MSVWWVLVVVLVSLQGHGRGCLEEEREGLLKLRDAFINSPIIPNPNNFSCSSSSSCFSSWDVSKEIECCNWEKVTCDPISRRVTHLSLDSTRRCDHLGGWTLDASLFLPFHRLQVLILFSNRLTGLSKFPRLEKLEVLDLGYNWLTTLPSIGALPSLKTLDMESNKLNNSAQFDEVTSLKKLEVLNLGYNLLTGSIPAFVEALPSLKALSLLRNQLNGSLPIKVLCKLRNLEELDLSRNQFEGSLPPCLSHLTSLRLLQLRENNLKGTIPPSLFTNLTSLEYVSLSSNSFEGSFSLSSLANCPKLEVFELININSKNDKLEVDTELPPNSVFPFQLRILRLSNCTLNKPMGTVPSFLQTQHNLRVVDLSHNDMLGTVPSWLLGNNPSLEYLNLMNNSLVGTLDLKPNIITNPNLFWFDVSSNNIEGEIPSNLGFAFPKLLFLNISRNDLRGVIPPSLGEMRDLYSLDLSNNSLSGELPDRLAVGCVNLTFLKLSNNHLYGNILPENSNLERLWSLHLDNNRFTGGISKGILKSSRLSVLDISENVVSGEIPEWVGELASLSTLVLSKNFLEGSIPYGMCNLTRLRFLDLSHNRLFGSTIPPCLNVSSLSHFHMQNNHLSGPIPYVLSHASSLVTLDLRDNDLSGAIPGWIALLPNLRVLLLRGNNLEGTIPFTLCQLTNISILDFSHNHLSGSIPSCLKDIGFGRRSLFDGTIFNGMSYGWTSYRSVRTYSHLNQLRVYQYTTVDYYMRDENDLVQFVTKRRYESYEGNVLYYMSGVDFSYNKLTGPIPPDIGLLGGLHTLNLSHNSLTGSIPESFSQLSQIESLDLSYNMLSGEVPPQMVGLNFLSVFSVAYNFLSGSLPEMKGQFATFDSSSYEGNYLLCGPPLQKSCREEIETIEPAGSSHEESHEDDSSFREFFLYGFLGSFVVAFLGVIAFFYLSSYYLELVLCFFCVQFGKLPYCARISKVLGCKKGSSTIRFVGD